MPTSLDRIRNLSKISSTSVDLTDAYNAKAMRDNRKNKEAEWGILGKILKHHRWCGLGHWLFFVLMIFYTFLGSAGFYYLEIGREVRDVVSNDLAIKALINEAAEKMRIAATTTNATLEKEMKELYVAVLKVDAKYLWSTFDKVDRKKDGTTEWAWTFWAAAYYSITVWTTVGYGALNPVTYAGKIATIVYGTASIPYGMTAIRDFSVAILNGCTRVYARIVFKLRELRGIPVRDNASVSLGTPTFAVIIAIYTLLCGWLVHDMDADGAYWDGLSWYDSLYYAFVSVATIGMGDIIPNNVAFSALIMTCFFFGMPIFRIVNRNYYLGLENAVNGTAEAIHIRLDNMLGLTPPSDSPAIAPMRKLSERKMSAMGAINADTLSISDSETEEEQERRIRAEMINNFSIHSLAGFLQSRDDVFHGDYGRVTFAAGDLTKPISRKSSMIP